MESIIRKNLASWIKYLSETKVLEHGYCTDIAGDLGNVLSDLEIIQNWSKTCYETYTLVYTPEKVPWAIDHDALVIKGSDRVYLVDIPMKEYAYFDSSSEKWMTINNPPFNVHVIATVEDFLNAYPGMTTDQAEEHINRLQQMEKDESLDTVFSSDKALWSLSNNRYPINPFVIEQKELEAAGQLLLSFSSLANNPDRGVPMEKTFKMVTVLENLAKCSVTRTLTELEIDGVIYTPQNPNGKSLWAKWVKEGYLKSADVYWAFRVQPDGKRRWLAIRLDTGKGKGVSISLVLPEGKAQLKEMEWKFQGYINDYYSGRS